MPSFIQQLDEHGNPIVYTDVPALGKRRRAGTDEGMEQEMQMKITSQQYNASPTHNFYPAANIHPFRQIITPTRRSPTVHKRRLLHAISPKPSPIVNESYQDPFYTPSTTYTPAPYTQRNTTPTISLDAIQENIRTMNQTIISNQSSTATPSSTLSQQQGAAKKPNLSPCNVCKRRPMVKQDLDSFADCEGCGQRTCYICVRQCEGTAKGFAASNPAQHEDHEMTEDECETSADASGGEGEPSVGAGGGASLRLAEGAEKWPAKGGHRTMVCRHCCEEVRALDGEIRCLGCLRAEERG